MNITVKDLKPFQKTAAATLASMIRQYPSEKFKRRYNQDTGNELPFLCRLQAITGAGKTPMLALTAQYLRDGIILWTTNRSAIISQTLSNLKPGGKYYDLLPPDTRVFALDSISSSDWLEMMASSTGITILLATVGSFNQDGDTLKIHKTGRWDMLAGRTSNRQRQLYVFYDEGHGATERQFDKLIDLCPRALVLASASPLPADLTSLLAGKNPQELSQSLAERTVVVSTKDVCAAGLLKNRLYLMECQTSQAEALREANMKWQFLASKLVAYNQISVACFVVNRTLRGVEIWETLTQIGVDKSRIAVHLRGAEEIIIERKGFNPGLIDTHKRGLTPDDLRSGGYTHIIWNLSLREGWDEPFAYIGYFDDIGKSQTDRVQKLGRFVRQPNAQPFDDPDLNAAYFYFNVADEEFNQLIEQIGSEMEHEGYEIMAPKKGNDSPPSRSTEVVRTQSIPKIFASFGEDIDLLDDIILSEVPSFGEDDLIAKGSIQTRVVDMKTLKEDIEQRSFEARDGTDIITPWEYIRSRLMAIDSRIVEENGSRFSIRLQEHKKMRQPIQFGSDAMRQLDRRIPTIRQRLNDVFRLYSINQKYGTYIVPAFNLVSPDLVSNNPSAQDRYKVRNYHNAVHAEYNGLNPFEVKVADALDLLGYVWCRNPSTRYGYGIPITELGAESDTFYPDFLLWTEKIIWAIDPKGKHLAQEAVTRKLIDMSGVEGLSIPIKIALILEGQYTLNANNAPVKEGKDGYTLIRKTSAGVRALPDTNVLVLLKALTSNH